MNPNLSYLSVALPFSQQQDDQTRETIRNVMNSMSPNEYQILKDSIDRWILRRPGMGGVLYAHEVVRLSGENVVIGPTGQIVRHLHY